MVPGGRIEYFLWNNLLWQRKSRYFLRNNWFWEPKTNISYGVIGSGGFMCSQSRNLSMNLLCENYEKTMNYSPAYMEMHFGWLPSPWLSKYFLRNNLFRQRNIKYFLRNNWFWEPKTNISLRIIGSGGLMCSKSRSLSMNLLCENYEKTMNS